MNLIHDWLDKLIDENFCRSIYNFLFMVSCFTSIFLGFVWLSWVIIRWYHAWWSSGLSLLLLAEWNFWQCRKCANLMRAGSQAQLNDLNHCWAEFKLEQSLMLSDWVWLTSHSEFSDYLPIPFNIYWWYTLLLSSNISNIHMLSLLWGEWKMSAIGSKVQTLILSLFLA